MKTLERGLKLFRPVVRSGLWTYRMRQGVAAGLKRRGGFGFWPKNLSAEEQFLVGLDWKGLTVYDVGGYEGVFSLFFARAVGTAGRVFTFEPNPGNCRKIRENLRLNRFANVEVLPVALGAGPGTSRLVFWPDEPARGSINSDYQKSLRQVSGATEIEIAVDSLDNQMMATKLQAYPPDFIKIDVEAAELEVLAGMDRTLRKYRPRLFIEVHSGVDLNQLARGLKDKGYVLQPIEPTVPSDWADRPCDSTFHLYCVPA